MISLLIGHRGVGKTSLLKRLQNYFSEDVFFDLDREIVRRCQLSIEEIFQQKGENFFRQQEHLILRQLINETRDSKKNIWISLGAGFILDDGEFAQLVREFSPRVCWIRRVTDRLGRVFTDRPRLNQQVSALQESLQVFALREPKYFQWAHLIYDMPEGVFFYNDFCESFEKNFFSVEKNSLPWSVRQQNMHALTVDSSLCEEEKLRSLIVLQQKFQFYFELRDDLLNEEQILWVIQRVGAERCLYSLRREKQTWTKDRFHFLSTFLKVDCDCVLFRSQYANFKNQDLSRWVISFHNESVDHLQKDLDQAMRLLLDCPWPPQELKCAPIVNNFDELRKLEKTRNLCSGFRTSFLPRSLEPNRSWQWYRLLNQHVNALNFVRYHNGSATDQPSLFQMLAQSEILQTVESKNFAAVLGHPVQHSLSPGYHYDFFKKRNQSYFCIDIPTEQWDSAWSFLIERGLRYASVTAPHKKRLAQSTQTQLESANTAALVVRSDFSEVQAVVANTDVVALAEILAQCLDGRNIQNPIAVWGGEGILSALASLDFEFDFISSRELKLKEGSASKMVLSEYEVIIWAAPMDSEFFPPSQWQPSLIFDLNYFENSKGREYFLKQPKGQCQYVSGFDFFERQALEQQKFWRQYGS